MKRKCNRGFIVVPSETDGKLVPYFIKVRDKDIIWDEDHIQEPNLINISKHGEDRDLQYPVIRWSFTKDGWDIELYSNGQIKMRKCVDISSRLEFVSEYELNSTITLPINIIDNDKINVQVTNNGSNKSIASAIVNAKSVEAAGRVDTVKVELFNTFYTFDSNIRTYDNEKLYVEVSAYVEK